MPENGDRGIPPLAVSSISTLVNKTGSWKYIRPMYSDRVAPCNAACPVGIDIEGYMNLLREGRVDEAQDLLLRENPMPAVTGRVCHHPCEDACNRLRLDDAVSIHAVERTLGDRELGDPAPATPARVHEERVVVIGSGPAGLSCAYHLARWGYAVTVYEEADEPGGMLRLGIPAYRLPRGVLDRQIERIAALGVDIRCDTRVGEDVAWDALGCDAVFIATGAHRARAAGIDGESGPGIQPGLEFLKRVNAGERPEIGERVIVIGGGNTAIDCARTALRLGARSRVVYRRSRAEMPAIAQEVEEAEREGVEFTFLAAPTAARLTDGVLQGVECVRMKLGPPDDSGRRRPIPTDEHFEVEADTVLTAIGESAELGFLRPDLETESGGIQIGQLGATTGAAIFAGGDAANEPRTVADALGSGKRAAIGIDLYLRLRHDEDVFADVQALRLGPDGNVSVTRWRDDDPVRREAPVNEVVPAEALTLEHFAKVPRRADRYLTGLSAAASFDEVNRGLDVEDALEEALRCFNCGVCNECELCLIFCPDVAILRRASGGFEIDMSYCKGCGICAEECPRGAIVMTKEGL